MPCYEVAHVYSREKLQSKESVEIPLSKIEESCYYFRFKAHICQVSQKSAHPGKKELLTRNM